MRNTQKLKDADTPKKMSAYDQVCQTTDSCAYALKNQIFIIFEHQMSIVVLGHSLELEFINVDGHNLLIFS